MLPTLIIAGILIAFVSIAFYFTSGFGVLGHVNAQAELSELWRNGDYERVVAQSRSLLERAPMQVTPLAFAGFGSFYLGMQQIDEEKRLEHLDSSVRMLRKALLISQPPMEAEIHYVLAKAYYHLGEFYLDSCVEHMNRAIQLGFEGQDSYEYLALAYDGLDMPAESMASYQRAISANPSDLLYAGLAELYLRQQRFADAGRYFQMAIETSEDNDLIQRAQFNLGQVYLASNRYQEAEERFRAILDSNPHSADARYYLGRAYLLGGDRERARFEWREAVRLDPRHQQALRSLRND